MSKTAWIVVAALIAVFIYEKFNAASASASAATAPLPSNGASPIPKSHPLPGMQNFINQHNAASQAGRVSLDPNDPIYGPYITDPQPGSTFLGGPQLVRPNPNPSMIVGPSLNIPTGKSSPNTYLGPPTLTTPPPSSGPTPLTISESHCVRDPGGRLRCYRQNPPPHD